MLTDWRQTNRTFFSALEVERNVMFLILMLIVLVAALNIVSGMIMLVKDKGSAIAILRTMGATQGTIMRVFLITGGAIGVVGTLAGFALGLLITLNVETIRQFLSRLTSTNLFPPELYFLSQLPAELDWREVTTITRDRARRFPCWRRSTRPGRRPRSIPWNSCAVGEAAAGEGAPLALVGVERHYSQGDAKLHILTGADLVLAAGEMVALVAPSGAGKSTLLHIAGLLERPDGGDVDRRRARLGQARRCGPHAASPRDHRLRLSIALSSRANSRRSRTSCCRR